MIHLAQHHLAQKQRRLHYGSSGDSVLVPIYYVIYLNWFTCIVMDVALISDVIYIGHKRLVGCRIEDLSQGIACQTTPLRLLIHSDIDDICFDNLVLSSLFKDYEVVERLHTLMMCWVDLFFTLLCTDLDSILLVILRAYALMMIANLYILHHANLR